MLQSRTFNVFRVGPGAGEAGGVDGGALGVDGAEIVAEASRQVGHDVGMKR